MKSSPALIVFIVLTAGLATTGSAAPDFESTQLTAPQVVAAGQSVAAEWVVGNIGDTVAQPPWWDRLYLSEDATLDSYDHTLGQIQSAAPLSPGKSYQSGLNFTFPNVPTGTYYLILQVDPYDHVTEANEKNNLRTITVGVRVPDLQTTQLKASTAVNAGEATSATWTIYNSGNGEARAPWHDRLHLSTDKVLDGYDAVMGQTQWTSDLPAGSNYDSGLIFTFPNVPIGTYYLILRSDEYGVVYEQSESNNVTLREIEVIVPDLQTMSLSAPPIVDAGQSVSASWIIGNGGNAEARATWHDRLYLSKDAILDGNDAVLSQTQWKTDVPANSSYQSGVSFTFPNISPGAYYLILHADEYGTVYEQTETNNTIVRPIEVHVPDLAPITITAPAWARPGDTISVTWMVTNAGSAQAKADWWDRIYLSTNTSASPGAYLLLNYKHTNALPTLTRYTNEVEITFSSNIELGDYFLVVKSDHYGDVYEVTETNNLLAAPIRMATSAPPAMTLTTMRAARNGLPQVFFAASGVDVDRVEFTWNNKVVGTAYGTPFSMDAYEIPPATLSAMISEAGTIAASGFEASGTMLGTATSPLAETHEGMPTTLDLEQPHRDYTIFTDTDHSPNHSMLIRAYGCYERRTVVETPTGHSSGGVEAKPFTNGQFHVRFYVDGDLVHSSSNGIPSDPYYHEYEFNTVGLSVGTHHVLVELEHPEGYWDAIDSERFLVEQRHPDLRVSREVFQHSNHFEVTLTIRNDGSGPATLRRIRETMTGFQGSDVETTMALDATMWSYSHVDKKSVVDVDFGDANIPSDTSRTLTYRAVPILFQTEAGYIFGGDGSIEYADTGGTTMTESVAATTTFTSPFATRRSIPDAVANAFHGSDYLLVTSPLNIEQAYSATGAVTVLTGMAELASRRNGVLGYFNGAGLLRSRFRTGDLLAVADIFTGGGSTEEIFVGSVANDRIYGYGTTKEHTVTTNCQMPLCIELRAGDDLATGNVRTRYSSGTNFHSRDELVVAWGDTHGGADAGKILVYQYEYATPQTFAVHELGRSFSTGDKLAVGEVYAGEGDDQDEVIVAQADRLIAYGARGPWTLDEYVTFAAGDHFAAGNLSGNNPVELVIGSVGGGLRIYGVAGTNASGFPYYRLMHDVPLVEPLEADDAVAVGDVLGDEHAEIIVAFASRNQIRIYGYDAAHDRYDRVGRFDVTFDATDRLTFGYIGNAEKAQILIARGAEATHREAGTIEIYRYMEGMTPFSAGSLDRLIDTGGDWARRLAPDWTDAGYLLLVGETEIIPTFSKTWDVGSWGEDAGRVDYTDRNFLSTDSSYENNVPELSGGRIAGNTVARLCRALRTAVDVAGEPWRLNNSNAYCVSGHDPDNDDNTINQREFIADLLSGLGFSVLQHHEPDTNRFSSNAGDKDLIFFTPHGNPHSTAGINSDTILYHFDPLSARPLVYASSCLTGRYPASDHTFGEQLMWNHAAAYIGATEITWACGSHNRGWDRRLAQAFFGRLEAGRSVGRTLTLAKRHRLSGAANTYSSDWNRNRYHCAIYHLFGDPKLEIEWSSTLHPERTPLANAPALSMQGPISELQLVVPMFTITTNKGAHDVDIPGQEHVTELGRPIVPYYAATVQFPRNHVVQNVTLTERSGLNIVDGLKLPLVEPLVGGSRVWAAPKQAEGWWPDRDFDWSLTRNRDGSTELAIKVYAFFHNSSTGESRFHSNYVFGIAHAVSPLRVLHLTMEKSNYEPGEVVRADLLVEQTNSQPINVTAFPFIYTNESALCAQLPARPMPGLKSRGWCQFRWDTANHPPGDYVMCVDIRDEQGIVLDRARAEFELAGAAGRIAGFSMDPPELQLGQPVKMQADFDNTGASALNGTVIFVVQDAAGNAVEEFRRNFTNVLAGSRFKAEATWINSTLVPRNCQILVYAQFAGQTSAILVGADWHQAALRWDTITAANGTVTMRWPSVPGRNYTIEFTPDLTLPFGPIATGIPANPPQNRFDVAPTESAGYFRLREDWTE